MTIGILNFHISVTYCKSLKEKRAKVKPLLNHLHKEFNFSVAEMAYQDSLRECVISCAAISQDKIFLEKLFSNAMEYFENHFPELVILEHTTEYF